MSHKHGSPQLTPLEDTGCLRTTGAHGPKFSAKTKPTQSQLYKYDGRLGLWVSSRWRLLCGVPMWRGPLTSKNFDSQKSVLPLNPSGCQHQPQQLMSKKIKKREKSFLFHVKKYKYYIIDSERKCAEQELKVHRSEPQGWLRGWDIRTVLEWKQMLFCTKKKEKFAFFG